MVTKNNHKTANTFV